MIAFSGSPLDRADHLRHDPAALAGMMNVSARLLRLDGLIPALSAEGGLQWGSLAEAHDGAELVFLGLLDGRACFAAVPDEGAEGPAYTLPNIWGILGHFSETDLAIYGGARSLVDWHARHRFCARCGHSTEIAKGGWQRNCPACSAQHFPRTDPVTIMLVEWDDRLLLGRQPQFPPGRFSALAGFVEPGETVEEAVRREVLEEAGLSVGDVRYVASQPWPFPSQLMIGCHAQALGCELTIDKNELEEADWFTRREVEEALQGAETARFLAPPRQAVARSLLEWWMEQ